MDGAVTAVTVRVDDRLRLVGWLLAAGDWPTWEQARKPYRPHRVAEGTRRSLAAHRQHPAVLWAQTLAASSEAGLSALFAHALAGDWPDEAAGLMADFAAAQPQAAWVEPGPDWQAAADSLQAVLAGAGLGEFLEDIFGGLPGTLVVFPNLLYPGHEAVAVCAAGELVLSQPPPPAWGSSTPWHYDARRDEVLASLAEGFARGLLALRPDLGPLSLTALPVAVAVLFLRQAEGEAAADQFMLVEQRMRRLPKLAAIVAALQGRRGLPALGAALNDIAA
ncbi:MAG: hypothetical protein ABI847_07365 [Anaerolineales bacterium]